MSSIEINSNIEYTPLTSKGCNEDHKVVAKLSCSNHNSDVLVVMSSNFKIRYSELCKITAECERLKEIAAVASEITSKDS